MKFFYFLLLAAVLVKTAAFVFFFFILFFAYYKLRLLGTAAYVSQQMSFFPLVMGAIIFAKTHQEVFGKSERRV